MFNDQGQFRYWAFISYSSKDREVAKKFHKSLETYRLPLKLRGQEGRDGLIPKKLFPIFRDRDELPLSADLGSTIEDALSASRYLIVLCSKDSAQSHWVNEEIRYFKSLGREDRILAVILNGEPNASDKEKYKTECFPPALRFKVNEEGVISKNRVEPIGGDLREGGDGWRNVLLKAVAGITGLGFDTLVGRDIKRRRFRQSIAATIGLMVILVGAWSWDYYRVKTEYFANKATVWSLPVGIGELNNELRRARQYHYRFYSTQNNVRKIERVNSAGTPKNDGQEQGASIWELFYDESGKLDFLDVKDHNGKLIVRKEFSQITKSHEASYRFIDFKHRYNEAPLAMSSDAATLDKRHQERGIKKRSEITSHRISYDEQGRTIKITYHNSFRQNRPSGDGIYGQRFYYNNSKLPVRIENLGNGEKTIKNNTGIVALRLFYNELGDNLRRQYIGYSNNPIISNNNMAGSVVKRDKFGNLLEGVYLGINAEPVLHKIGGYHRWTQSFDEYGNRTEQFYFGLDWDQPVLNSVIGAHIVKQQYDSHGNVIAQSYFGINGEKINRPQLGYHEVRKKYNESGNIKEYQYFGVTNNPVLHNDIGAHSIRVRYDSLGNRIRQSLFGRQGKKISHQNHGYHYWKQSFDEQNNLVNLAYYDKNGSPILRSDIGIYRWSGVYDKHNNLKEEKYYGIMNEPIERRDLKYHSIVRLFNERGNPIEITYYDKRNNVLSRLCYSEENWNSCEDMSMSR